MTPVTQRRGRSLFPEQRFAAKVQVGACWQWLATTTPDGYGRFRDCGQLWLAHRWIWTHLYGPIPEGQSVDHQCRNPGCVNPDHLRLMPIYDNVMAGFSPQAINRRKTHCKRGHEFTAANTHRTSTGGRLCLTCKREYERTHPRRTRG